LSTTIKLWDPVVRLFHWSLALAFFANYFFTEEGEDWHRWLGYYACAWLAVRFFWGFAAQGAASWRACWPTASRLKSNLLMLRSGKADPHLGHSPIGALMMMAMMLAMLGLGVSGYMMEEIDLFWGVDWVQDLHATIADILAALVGIHILAAIIESIRLRENLPLSMITGNRNKPTSGEELIS
jgi:cytochrome b